MSDFYQVRDTNISSNISEVLCPIRCKQNSLEDISGEFSELEASVFSWFLEEVSTHCSVKGQMANIFNFVGHTDSVTLTQLCHLSMYRQYVNK